MRLLLRIIAIMITLIVVFLLPISLFIFQVGNILFSPQSMLNLVADHVIGPSQSNLVTETFLRGLPAELEVPDDSIVGLALNQAADRTDIHGSLFPSELQLIYAAQGINAFYDWLDGPNPAPQLRLDMNPFKDHLQNNTVGIVQVVLQEVPVCTAAESIAAASELLGAILGGEVIFEDLPSCLPEILPMETVVPAVSDLLQQQINLIPQTITFDGLITASPQALVELKAQIQLAKGFVQWSWLPFVFLLIIASIIGGQSKDGIPLWLGVSLLLLAGSTFLTTLLPVNIWLAFSSPQLSDWSPLFRIPTLFILAAVYEDAGQGLLWFSLAMTLLGLGMILLALIIKRSQAKSA